MQDANGVGLAANQAGILRRVFVFRHGEEEEPVALVNPRIAEPGDELETDDEGCLSLQGVLIPVERPATVVLRRRTSPGRRSGSSWRGSMRASCSTSSTISTGC